MSPIEWGEALSVADRHDQTAAGRHHPTAGGAHSGPERPSPIMVYIDDRLGEMLPDGQYGELTADDRLMADTSSDGDFYRCLHCARFAVELAARPEHAHLRGTVAGLEEVVREFRDTEFAVRFGLTVAGASPVTDVEVAWVDAALEVMRRVAEASGWDRVPWRQLLDELAAMEPAPRSAAPTASPHPAGPQPT